MRERLLTKGAETLTELEILEMLLPAGQLRGDTKPLAKILIRQFVGLRRSASARTAAVRSAWPCDASISALKLVEAAGLHLAHSDIHNRPVHKLGRCQTLQHHPVCA